MKTSSAASSPCRHSHHQPVFADRKSDSGRRHGGPQRLGETVVAAAAKDGILRPQIAVSDFKGGAHVVIEAAHQTRFDFIRNAAIGQVGAALA